MRYSEQFERILRWRDRLNSENINYKIYKDNLLAFFMNCWHLKDWLETELTTLIKEIEVDIYRSNNLKLCQSIANASKHLNIKNKNILPVRIYQELNIPPKDNIPCTKESKLLIRQDTKGGYNEECVEGNLMVELLDHDSPEIKHHSFTIADDNGLWIDALELADNCITDWENIFVKYDL